MNPIIRKLYDTGHFWNPAHAEALNVRWRDLDKLTTSDQAVVEAVSSYQAIDANMEILSALAHKRAAIHDGDIGPATSALLELPRCPLPDFPPPPGVEFHYDNPCVQKAVETMREFATGSGSWPHPGCDPQRSDVHSIRINLNTARCPATIKGYLNQALEAVVAAYAEIGLAVRYVLDGNPSECEIEKSFEALAGSVIGWNEFPNPGTCNQVISGRLDTGYTPSDYRYWANLECHETGHGVGLNHGNGHIMNPSILLVWPLSWVGSYSYTNLKRWFGGEPISPTTPPTPPNPPAPNQTYITGILKVIRDNQTLGEFIVVPKPNV